MDIKQRFKLYKVKKITKNNLVTNHQCIYCKKIKNNYEFNVEHVIPKMYGRYNDALTLHDFEVCKECNDFF